MDGRFEYTNETFLEPSSKRNRKKFADFKKKNGFTPDETYGLNATIAKFTIPRMRYFMDNLHGYPTDTGSVENWKKILEKIIIAMELIQLDPLYPTNKTEKKIAKDRNKKMKEGFKLLGKYFVDLWD